MDAFAKHFVKQLLGTSAATLVLVIAVAFLSIPYSLGGHPGEPRPADTILEHHLS